MPHRLRGYPWRAHFTSVGPPDGVNQQDRPLVLHAEDAVAGQLGIRAPRSIARARSETVFPSSRLPVTSLLRRHKAEVCAVFQEHLDGVQEYVLVRRVPTQ